MAFISAFNVLGPEMIGPSSSHTARQPAPLLCWLSRWQTALYKDVEFVHYIILLLRPIRATERIWLFLAGVMGFSTDDRADTQGLFHCRRTRYFLPLYRGSPKNPDIHPNTVDIHITCSRADVLYTVRGESLGGGKMRISRINHIDVDFSGEYSTLIIIHYDRPGVLAHITGCLSEKNVNIAFMKLFRETKGDIAYSIIEFDGTLPDDAEDTDLAESLCSGCYFYTNSKENIIHGF